MPHISKNVGVTGRSVNRDEFLGGLSLHLNHLIASWQWRISYWQFRTLPIGILLSNLVSRQLMTYPRTLFGSFWHMSIFGDSRAVWVLLSKYRAFRKSIFSWWRSDGAFKSGCGGFRWAGWLGYIVVPFLGGGSDTLGRSGTGFSCKWSIFWHICNSLEGTRHWLISSRISP